MNSLSVCTKGLTMYSNNSILVIDSALSLSQTTVGVLQRAGYKVQSALNASAGWRALERSPLDLILLNVILPDGDGVEICRKIKSDPALSHILILLVSDAPASSEDRSAGLEAGADGYIGWPMPDREFLAQVQALLRIKQTDGELRESANEQLHSLSARLQSMLEEERTRISREIHDELGQILTSLKMDLHWVESGLEEIRDPRINPILDKLVAATELADTTLQTVQRIAAELRPGTLDRLGLPMALRCELDDFHQRTGISTVADIGDDEAHLPPEMATAFFRIFQEALTNVARHAKAGAVEIAFRAEGAFYVLEIRDNGRGISESNIAGSTSLGLLGMRERAALLGGTVEILRGEVSGTTVIVRLPKAALE